MKIKITRADGTVIEATGSVEECERLLAAERPAPSITVTPYYAPATCPSPYYVNPPTWQPTWTSPGVYTVCGDAS